LSWMDVQYRQWAVDGLELGRRPGAGPDNESGVRLVMFNRLLGGRSRPRREVIRSGGSKGCIGTDFFTTDWSKKSRLPDNLGIRQSWILVVHD